MGKSQRTKGHSFERRVAKLFREFGFSGARRKLEYHIDDCIGIDLDGTAPFAVQCKAYKDYCPISKINEVKEHMYMYIPVLVTKGDGKPPMAVVNLADFLNMAKVYKEYGYLHGKIAD